MSSRTPAPDDFGRFTMPDLPGDVFEDDGPMYAPVDATYDPYDEDDQVRWDEEADGRTRFQDRVIEDRTRPRERRPANAYDDGGARRRRPAPAAWNPRDTEHPPRSTRRPDARLSSTVHPREDRRRPLSPRQEYASRSRVLDQQPDARPGGVQQRRKRAQRDDPRAASRQPVRQDRIIEQPRMQAEAVSADIVTSISPAVKTPAPRPRVRRQRNPAWQWQPIVMPQPRQMLVQAFPSWVMAASVLGTLAVMGFIPGGLPLWAPMVLLPTLLLLLRADHERHPMWGRAALINLGVVGAFFPMMIVRQSFLRVPFVEFGNGTLVMPILSTVAVIVAMALVAFGSAFLSQDDPEYAGMLFLPAAMLVPFFAGATEITNLSTALVILAVIYGVVGILTIVASMLPAAFPTMVAPVALALEFFVLPVSESTPIFPLGAGMSAKLLFFVVLAVGVGLTVAVPMMAVWVRQVRRIVQGQGKGQPAAGASAA